MIKRLYAFCIYPRRFRIAVPRALAYTEGMEDTCVTSWWKSFLEHFGFITDKTIYNLMRKIMTTVQELKNQLAEIAPIIVNVSGDVDSLLAQIAALQAEILSGKVATQEDLDELAASAQAIKDSLSTVDAKEPVQP